MGFGVISFSILLAQGVPPALASASVNAAKLPTTGTAVPSRAPTVVRLENVIEPVQRSRYRYLPTIEAGGGG